MQTEYEKLKSHYGNHTLVANILGITPRQYRRIRNQRQPSKTIKNLMQLKIQELEKSIADEKDTANLQ